MADELENFLKWAEASKTKTPGMTFDISGLARKIKTFAGAARVVKTEVGFLTRSKKHRPKIFFAVRGGQEFGIFRRTLVAVGLKKGRHQPARSPVPHFLNSPALKRVQEKMARDLEKEFAVYMTQIKPASAIPVMRKVQSKYYGELESIFWNAAWQVEPIVKDKRRHKSLIPLTETGGLMRTIKARNAPPKRKK